MPRRQHVVRLTVTDRRHLERLIRAGTASARTLSHARILLKADTGGRERHLTDAEIADAVEVSTRTVARVRAAFCTHGLERALERKPPDRVYPRKLDGAGEAVLFELACGPAPLGHATWSLRLLRDALVELQVVESIGHQTVGAALKKTHSSPTGFGVGIIREPTLPS